MIYSIPSDILNNLPLIIEQSKLMATNTGIPNDPLYMAYRNFINELNKYNSNQNGHNFSHNNEEDEMHSVDDMMSNIKNTASDIHRHFNDVNNNKKFDNLKGKCFVFWVAILFKLTVVFFICNLECNKKSSEKDPKQRLMMNNKQQQACLSNKSLPVFSNVSQVKNDVSIYMPFYYPVDHYMLNLTGPISTFCNRIKVKSSYYMSPNRQTFEIIVETELSKAMPGQIVLEQSENLVTNKSFNKLVARLKKHFPNLSMYDMILGCLSCLASNYEFLFFYRKQLVELTIQSKYAIMKKHKLQYGFSGFKIKDLVKYIIEYICENVCTVYIVH